MRDPAAVNLLDRAAWRAEPDAADRPRGDRRRLALEPYCVQAHSKRAERPADVEAECP